MKKKFVAVFLAALMALSVCALSACADKATSNDSGAGTTNGLGFEDSPGEAPADTPEADLLGLSVGASVSTNGMTITLNSIEEGPAASDGSESYKINVTYENHSGKMNSVSPFDWYSLASDDTETGYDMDGKGSFNLVTLPEEKKFTGDVILFKTEGMDRVMLRPTLRWSEITATWVLP